MQKDKEQGVAILYVLGILALLIAMALAFMNSSIFDQRSAAHSTAGALAEQLAMSTVEEVIAAIQTGTNVSATEDTLSVMTNSDYYRNGKATNSNSNVLHPTGSNSYDKLFSAFDTFDIISGSKVYILEWEKFTDKSQLRWKLHRVNIGQDGTKPINMIIGRTAFILHPLGSSQLDPSFLVKRGVNESDLTQENRRGQDISEINVQSIRKPYSTVKSFFDGSRAGFLNYWNENGGKRPETEVGWATVNDLLTEMKTQYPISADQMKDIGTFANTYFICDSIGTTRNEEYTMICDNGIPSPPPPGTLKLHRFYLPRFNDKKDSLVPPRRNGEYDVGEENLWNNLDINTKILLTPGTSATTPPYEIGVDLTNASTVGAIWQNSTLSSPDIHADDDALGVGIQWLANFGLDKDGVPISGIEGTFADILLRRQQIAANLKDYCDDDNIPTSDVTPGLYEDVEVNSSAWGFGTNGSVPKYTGNEKTPYINEFQVTTTYSVDAAQTTYNNDLLSPEYQRSVEATFEFGIQAEIVNIYKDGTGPLSLGNLNANQPRIKVYCRLVGTPSITLELLKGSSVDGTVSESITLQNEIIVLEGTAGAWVNGSSQSYFLSTSAPLKIVNTNTDNLKATSGISTTEAGLPDKVKLSLSFELEIVGAVLAYGVDGSGHHYNVDYSKIGKTLKFIPKKVDAADVDGTATCASDAGIGQETHIYSVQTEDPRQNLNIPDWYDTGGFVSDSTITNLGLPNIKSNPSTPEAASLDDGYDSEEATDPAFRGDSSNQHLSTAYIRNAPMLSPWELGFIHRGKKWQTLNLKDYDTDKANKAVEGGTKWFLPGGGRYDAGDANILDQIKMTPEAKSPVKVNLSGADDEILNALFSNIFLNCSPVTKGSTGSTIVNISRSTTATDEITPDFISSLLLKLKTPRFKTRAEIAKILSDESRTIPTVTRKADFEELVGKVINLVDLYPSLQLFEIIVLSQAIKDVGNPTSLSTAVPISKSYYDTNHRLQTPVSIDAYIGEINWSDGTNQVIADEILARRKIRVRGFLNQNNEVQLISIRTSE